MAGVAGVFRTARPVSAAALAAAAGAGAVGCAAAGCQWPALSDSASVYDENGRASVELVRATQGWVRNRKETGSNAGSEGWVSMVKEAATVPLDGKRILVFVNPVCGRKAAQAHCDDVVLPILSAMGCTGVEVQQTDDKSSAMELLESADLGGIDAILVLGGGGTVNEIVRGLAMASASYKEEIAIPVNQRPVWYKPKPEPLSIPIGVIPEGSENMLYNSLNADQSTSAGTEADVVSAMLRIARFRKQTVPLLQCQSDDGQSVPLLGSGLRFATEQSLSANASRLGFLKLPHLKRKLAEMWATLRMHKYKFRISYLLADSDDEVPSFEEWEVSDTWQIHEGNFLWLGVLPFTVTGGGGDGGGQGAGWLAWAFDTGELSRTDLERLQAGYRPSEVGSKAEEDCHLLVSRQVKAFEIECLESKDTGGEEWKRLWSRDGEVPFRMSAGDGSALRIRGASNKLPLVLLK